MVEQKVQNMVSESFSFAVDGWRDQNTHRVAVLAHIPAPTEFSG